MNSENLLKIFEANKKRWNDVVDDHVSSEFYKNEQFKQTGNSLNSIELEYLPNLIGLDVCHIQCHFGQDSISLAKLGAKVTASDFSEKAISAAKFLAEEMHSPINFIQCNTYDLLDYITEKFDLIYMTYGVLPWLPDIEKLALICKKILKPGGKVFIVEFHPTLYMFDFVSKEIKYHYNNQHVYAEEIEMCYTGDKILKNTEYFWNHSFEEIFSAFLAHGFSLSKFKEYLYSPYNCFPNMKNKSENEYVFDNGEYPLSHCYLCQFELSIVK